MDTQIVARERAQEVACALDMPEIQALIAKLQATRWTGRPGYPIRMMIGLCLTKAIYALSTFTRTVALVSEHQALQEVLECDRVGVPSVHACYRFTKKLLNYDELLQVCISRVLISLHQENPCLGENIAIDASDLPAYANGQKYVSKKGKERERFSDPDASWGHRSAVSTRKGGGFYGYRLHLAVCSQTDLPLAWEVHTARDHESTAVASLLDSVKERSMAPRSCSMDKAYDIYRIYDECQQRGAQAIIPLKETPAVKRGDHNPPSCEHGIWTFAGADRKRKATKWRCPTGECKPASVWVKADRLHPLIPRETKRWRKLYRQRGSVERVFGRLKNEWALAPLRVRRLERVQLHADLTILAKLCRVLANARLRPALA